MTVSDRYIAGKLEKFDSVIHLNYGQDFDVFRKFLTDYPKYKAYIESCDVETTGLVNKKIDLYLAYHNTDVPVNDVFTANGSDEVFSALMSCVSNFKRSVIFVYSMPVDDLLSAANMFLEKYGVLFAELKKIVIGNCWSFFDSQMLRLNFEYIIGRVKLGMMEREVSAEVDRIANMLFTDGMPKEAIAYLVHNYLATSVVYHGADAVKNLEKSYVHSAYGALITKKCVCQGIAEAYKRILNKCGVDCDVVCGTVDGYDDYHAWNIIKLNGSECFHVDVTWDISDGAPSLSYFGKSDAYMSQTRHWNTRYYAKCQSGKNLYIMAKRYVTAHKEELLESGVTPNIIGF